MPIFQKVRYENWGMVFAVWGLRSLSFRFSPESADMPFRFIVPIITVFSFVYFPIVAGSRRAICSMREEMSEGVCEASRICCENGGGSFVLFSVALEIVLFDVFGIRRHTTQTYYAPNFQCSICFFIIVAWSRERCVLG